jgi:hypothetical protein
VVGGPGCRLVVSRLCAGAGLVAVSQTFVLRGRLTCASLPCAVQPAYGKPCPRHRLKQFPLLDPPLLCKLRQSPRHCPGLRAGDSGKAVDSREIKRRHRRCSIFGSQPQGRQTRIRIIERHDAEFPVGLRQQRDAPGHGRSCLASTPCPLRTTRRVARASAEPGKIKPLRSAHTINAIVQAAAAQNTKNPRTAYG